MYVAGPISPRMHRSIVDKTNLLSNYMIFISVEIFTILKLTIDQKRLPKRINNEERERKKNSIAK